ncbi:Gfo/Idh/MocA family oxidoreductase [Microbacterium sp. EYE_5]|uniref:Gfo/Idh/MocA family protein n=1 Tax=unclassified Microbacterium TaxID=2609290 RepID=UPI002004C43E|nr:MULTISPECIES: Gfo/Idh/MocA family oxidoreductase [unclassified Microbacterium]MCK6079273.1 Gfo/Idh/MocA family oxidoreductase [Microbacterium sp. EYE_382]MCK6084543.1 Gfo/Idh/MocA family oxidoreductase [Microbacterium sp. EYE_384]MCK6123228.1 Gfo/Idh/MocA family oxidoreductase [Microbacterium sp. EYE_80]MCK6125307.1 Gfo/Idh/MocA family oxidoreductase [Microbacterium sp. EYE_79]MCK6140227.1 Gfo/Idh/MocA family oxidoreductase [Microbacterium sp. EYE_39]
MTTTLRCALIGTGSVAHLHARAVAAHPRAELVAVTDHRREAADAFAREWGEAAVYDDLDALLAAERPDVVLICTPPAVHAEQAVASLEAGAHVVVEKPPAPSLEELDRMRGAAERTGRRLAVVFQQRTGTAAAHVRGLLRSGALGRPLLAACHTLWFRGEDYFAVDWRGTWRTEGGGTTLGHGIHQLDLLAYLLGDWATVQGRLWRLDRETETEDASTATVTFASGVVAQVLTSAVSPRQTSSIRIDTQKATVTVDHLYGHGHENWAITPAPGFEGEAEAWRLPDVEERSDHAPLLRDVFDALLSGDPLPPTADEPARSFELVTAIYASAAADGAVVTPAALAAHPTHRAGLESPVTDMRPGLQGERT